MNKMMSYCGLMCDECLAYKATVNDSDELRKETAKQWSEMYHVDVKPENINCRGCRSDVLFTHCNVCEIRLCNLEKQLDHCGYCDSSPCTKNKHILDNVPGAEERLKTNK